MCLEMEDFEDEKEEELTGFLEYRHCRRDPPIL